MLARANRVVRPEDFRQAVRRGRRVGTTHSVLYLYPRDPDAPTRFGFIVSRAVGGAVIRNRVRRRLRAIGYGLLPGVGSGRDVVVRALPGIEQLAWATLRQEISDGLDKGSARR